MTQRSLGLFGGVGGWDVHDRELGIETFSLDNDPAATMTHQAFIHQQYGYRDSGPGCEVADVTKIDGTSYGLIDGMKSSPPCGKITVAGNGAGRKDIPRLCEAVERMRRASWANWDFADPDSALMLQPLRIFNQLRNQDRAPTWFVMEQTKEALPVWNAYAETFAYFGYSVWAGLMHAEQYSVPSSRTRAVFIAHRYRAVGQPKPIHSRYHVGAPEKIDPGLKRWVSMGDVLPELVDDHGTYLRSNYGTGGVAANRGQRTLQQPAGTITRKFNRNKWVVAGQVVRGMTVSEAARIQTFPTDYPWCGNETQIQLQIGNAIPPMLALAILETVV